MLIDMGEKIAGQQGRAYTSLIFKEPHRDPQMYFFTLWYTSEKQFKMEVDFTNFRATEG